MNEADQMEDDKWPLTHSLTYSVGETVGNSGESGILSGIAEPWLHLLPCRNVGLVLPWFVEENLDVQIF